MPTTLETRPLSPHPQRPWRAVPPPPRRAARKAARTFYAPVVRELTPRAPGEPVGLW